MSPFDGKTYDQTKDCRRLMQHLVRVEELMKDGEWRTLSQVSAAVGCSEAGASARLRDLRKDRFGGFIVLRRRLFGGGLHVYRVTDYKGRVWKKDGLRRRKSEPGKGKRKTKCGFCKKRLEWFEALKNKKVGTGSFCRSCLEALK